MSLMGTVVQGTIVLDREASLPDGTRVEVVVKELAAPARPPTLGERLQRLAGTIRDLPADFAAEHDHYLHGTPRRTPKGPE